MKIHLSPIGKSNIWITPKYITQALGNFDLDPCANITMPYHHAKKEFTIEDNGLIQDWRLDRVWLNPPYDRREIGKWMKKMSRHMNGIMLVPAAMETKNFKEYVYPYCNGILFLDHRPKFFYQNGEQAKANCGQALCLVAYGHENLLTLIHSGLGVTMGAYYTF